MHAHCGTATTRFTRIEEDACQNILDTRGGGGCFAPTNLSFPASLHTKAIDRLVGKRDQNLGHTAYGPVACMFLFAAWLLDFGVKGLSVYNKAVEYGFPFFPCFLFSLSLCTRARAAVLSAV